MSLAAWLIAAYLMIVLVIAYFGWKKRKDNLQDFYVQSRSAGKFVAFMTFSATLFSSFTMVGMPGFFYTHGIGSWMFIAFADIFMALMIFVIGRRMWALGKRFGYVTPSEFLGDRYDSKLVMIISGLIGIVFLLPYISTQLIGAGILLSEIGLSLVWGSAILAIVLLVYSELGGMRSIAWTDALQGSILLIISFAISAILLVKIGGVWPLFSGLARSAPEVLSIPGPKGLFTYQMMLSYFVLIIFMPATQPQLTVRYFLPKNKKALQYMMIATALFAFLVMVPAMIIGLGGKLIDPALASGDLALPTILGLMPSVIASLAIVSVIASSMSTADSQILTLSSIVTKDYFVKLTKKKIGRKARMRIARISMFLLLGIAFLISTKPPTLIVTLSILSFAGTIQMLPAMLGALFWKRATAPAAISSMLAGVGVLCAFQWWLKPLWGFHPGALGLAASSAVFLAVSLITTEPSGMSRKIVEFLKKEFGTI